ncbi:12484_t:CDS:2, partial [Gigaspora margarita]
ITLVQAVPISSSEGNNVLASEDLPNSPFLLTYTATIVSDSYIPDNQCGRESFALAKKLYNSVTNNKNINQHKPLNNKHSRDKVTSLNFVDLISQIQKGTPTSETTYGEPSSSTTNYEDNTLISNDDSTELLHVRPQSITSNTKYKVHESFAHQKIVF